MIDLIVLFVSRKLLFNCDAISFIDVEMLGDIVSSLILFIILIIIVQVQIIIVKIIHSNFHRSEVNFCTVVCADVGTIILMYEIKVRIYSHCKIYYIFIKISSLLQMLWKYKISCFRNSSFM